MGRGWKRARKLSTAPVPYPTTGPALAETDRAFAFAPFHHARHGGEGVGLRGECLQLRAGDDLGRSPGGEPGPAADQLFPCAGCGERVPANSASGSLGGAICRRTGPRASPHRSVQAPPITPSAKLSKGRLAPPG